MLKGDRNTSFFHSRTLKKRRHNHIEALKIDGRGWVFDSEILQRHAIEYFSSLYSVDNSMPSRSFVLGKFPKLSESILAELRAVVTPEEVRRSLFSMSPLKAPEVDGLHAKFYQVNWDIVGDNVFRLVSRVFVGDHLDAKINKTLLVLIPKTFGAESISQYRPISLCNVLYKVITKTIIIRLRQSMQVLV